MCNIMCNPSHLFPTNSSSHIDQDWKTQLRVETLYLVFQNKLGVRESFSGCVCVFVF